MLTYPTLIEAIKEGLEQCPKGVGYVKDSYVLYDLREGCPEEGVPVAVIFRDKELIIFQKGTFSSTEDKANEITNKTEIS